MLPSPEQTWAHSTCTKVELEDALEDDSITAIESDIVMGRTLPESEGLDEVTPIMSHPPKKTSDLSFHDFIKMSIDGKTLRKHIKLDIKEFECIDPVSKILRQELQPIEDDQRAVYLNADILPGPGNRQEPPINGDIFIEKCMDVVGPNASFCAFSLGWMSDCRAISGYTREDVIAMKELIFKHSLRERCMGVVLAVNARVLVKRLEAFDEILEELPFCQLLIWTATGEPKLSITKFRTIKEHYEGTGCSHRVGFDCKVSQGFNQSCTILYSTTQNTDHSTNLMYLLLCMFIIYNRLLLMLFMDLYLMLLSRWLVFGLI